MQTRFPAVLTAALSLAAFGLPGCSSGTAVGTVTHTPALQTNGGRASAHSTVQTSILAVETSTGINVPGGLTPASAIRIVRSIAHRRGISATGSATGACINSQRQSQVTNSDGTVVTTTDLYYDATCTTLENEEVVTTSPANGSVQTAKGTLTTYDRAGNVTSSHALTLSEETAGTNETITLTDNASKTAAGAVIASLGATCVGNANSPKMTCSAAHYGTNNSTTTGEALSDSTAAATSTTKNTTTINASFYLGALGITFTGTNWAITNASAFNVASGTFTFDSAGNTGSGTLTVTDNLYTYSETGTLSSTGLALTLVELPNSAVTTQTPIATANLDAGGNGTLSYADGTSEAIWGGFVGL